MVGSDEKKEGHWRHFLAFKQSREAERNDLIRSLGPTTTTVESILRIPISQAPCVRFIAAASKQASQQPSPALILLLHHCAVNSSARQCAVCARWPAAGPFFPSKRLRYPVESCKFSLISNVPPCCQEARLFAGCLLQPRKLARLRFRFRVHRPGQTSPG